MAKRLSGWARLWIVIWALTVVASLFVGYQWATAYDYDQWTYVGTHVTPFQYWLRFGAAVIGGVLYGGIAFVVAMIAKSAAIWVYRGFRPDRRDA